MNFETLVTGLSLRVRPSDPVYRCADDPAALVDGEFKFDALLLKIFHGFVYSVAENLFIVSRGYI